MLQPSPAAAVETKVFPDFSWKWNQMNKQIPDILGLALAGKMCIKINKGYNKHNFNCKLFE